ncbi:hypothetical protein [Halorussus sp. AFM4]|uniref:hypothetical protein n=1 Tax=Halorussus sp. AFM4 TaxID=3421651 RepID=UPI003EBD8193
MTAPHALRDLAALIENLDDATLSIDGVQTPEGSLVDGRTLTAELTARLDWGDLDDVGSAVSVGLPDGSETEADESGVTFPLAVELDVGDGAAETEPVAETAETAKTQVTDGGVAMTRASDDKTESPDEVQEPAATDDRDGEQGEESDSSETRDRGDEGVETEDEAVRKDEAARNDEEAREGDEPTDGDDAAADATPEPHRDPERLREAYESCETFPEMAEALGASVTPQTVRYHAIELGIHRPNERPKSAERSDAAPDSEDATAADEKSGDADEPSEEDSTEDGDASSDAGTGGPETSKSETGDQPTAAEGGPADSVRLEQSDDGATEESDGEAESRPPALRTEDLPADVDLPSHVALADLRDAVRDATTLYEVQRDLRVDRSAARRLLRDLNLLDLVTGRAATADERTVSAASIDERIRRACT